MSNIDKLKTMLEAPASTQVAAYTFFLTEMLRQEEQLKLHNLENDPEDLPEIGKDVLIYYSYGEGIKTCIGFRSIFDKFMLDNERSFISREFVKGWREMRGFEE